MSASGVRVKESSSTTSWCSEKTQERRDPAPSDSHCCTTALSLTLSSPLPTTAMRSRNEHQSSSVSLPKDHRHWQPSRTRNKNVLAMSNSQSSLRLLDSLSQDPNRRRVDETNPSENADLYCGDEDYDSDWENENSGLSGLIRREILPKYFYMGGNYFVTHDTEASDTDENVLFAYGRRGEV
mmetsp:Transcript_10978/g.31835  ORF Transcript_10978/g.31835 Transcript_10978/m.31835 type:complete len:182 (+) Transcript_10978:187-732(+)